MHARMCLICLFLAFVVLVLHLFLLFMYVAVPGTFMFACVLYIRFDGMRCVRIMHFVPERGNPRYYACYLDEDLISRMKLGARAGIISSACLYMLCGCDYV